MANPVIKVILSAVDEITGVTKKAGESVSSFSDKAKAALGSLAALGVGAALGAFFKSAIEEASAAEVGMGRLGTAVRNAGGNFESLKPQLEDTVASVMRLSTATDDDLRAALTNMITISGDVEGSQKNLALAADLAAFKHISLEEAATVVGKAMNGNVTAFNKMGVAGKDATTVLENARASFGGFAAKEAATFSGTVQRINNQWGEFQEAVGTAILSSGDMGSAADGLAGILAGLAGWVEENEGAFRLVTGAVGDAVGALIDVGRTLWEVAGPALQFIGKYVGGALVAALNTAVFGVRGFAASFKSMAGTAIDALGLLVEKGGKLLKLFGVTVVTEAGTSMRQFGQQLVASAQTDMQQASAVYTKSWEDLLAGRKASNRRQLEEEAAHGGRMKGETEAQAKERTRIAKAEAAERERILKDVYAKLEAATKGLNLSTAELSGYWQGVDREAKKAQATITLSVAEQKQLADRTKGTADAQARVAAAAAEAQQHFEDNVDSAVSLGISFISAANGMGKISDEAATALASVVNMGGAIAKFGIGSPEGILAIVGGLAQLIGGWGSSAVERARKDAQLQNTRALEELTQEFGDYNGSASGRVFGGVESAISEAVATASGEGRTPTNVDVLAALKKRGLTEADARKLADRFGIDVDKDPFGWYNLGVVLSSRKFGSGEGNFADELSSITDSWGVLGVEDADDKIEALRTFAKKNIPILAEALTGDFSSESGRSAVIAKLRALYSDSINAKLAPADYKNATPQQFRAIIAQLLPLLGDANGLLASGLSAGVGIGSGPPGGTPATGGTSSLVGGVGGTLGLGVNGAGGGVVLPTPVGIPDAFGGGAATAGMVINGGVTQNFYLTQREGEASDEFLRRLADEVDLRLIRRYDSSRAAAGSLSGAA